MSDRVLVPRSRLTLALCTVLHAFTHAYGTVLVPLYLLMVADLRLRGVWQASLVVTIYGFVYCAASYAAGVLADRTDRKLLLGIGLIGNALAIGMMGLTRRYDVLLALGVIAGLFGAFFHPAANALVTAHFPKSPGMAIGVLGIGAGVGFFAGPQFAGWRAQAGGWHAGQVADWQRPLLEIGAAGFVAGVAFLLLAREAERRRGRATAGTAPGPRHNGSNGDTAPPGERLGESRRDMAVGAAATPVHLSGPLRRRVLAVAATLACRDFGGVASVTLVSIYLQRAHRLDTKHAGFIVGAMMLISIVVNPLAVYLSPGRRRLPALVLVLLAAAAVVATAPAWGVAALLPVLCVFQACHLGSYAISDAAILERVDPLVRGRVVGLFLTVAGTFASTAPWVMGFWTDAMGEAAGRPSAYYGPFGLVAGMMALATTTAALIPRLGQPRAASPVEPLSEVNPAMLEPMG